MYKLSSLVNQINACYRSDLYCSFWTRTLHSTVFITMPIFKHLNIKKPAILYTGFYHHHTKKELESRKSNKYHKV